MSTQEAIALQRKLSQLVRCVDDPLFKPRFLCGLDAAYDGNTAFVAAAVWDLKAEKIVEIIQARDNVSTDYIPGFLAFREGPLLVRIAAKLQTSPEVFLIDGQGIAHPRRFGLACHIGLALDKSTIGVAKSLLYGRLDGDRMVDPYGVIIGRILNTAGGKKYYVSVGNRISLDTAFGLVQSCIVEEAPSPLRRAHLDSVLLKRSTSS